MPRNVGQPGPDEFFEFASLRRALFAMPAELSSNVATLKTHRVYCWLRKQPGYLAAEASLSKKNAFQSATLPVQGAADSDYESLYFAMIVAQCLGGYLVVLQAPAEERKGVITSADLREAKQAADILRNLIERGLTLPDTPGNALELYSLLGSIPSSPDSLPMTSQRAGDHVPAMQLITSLALMLHSHYDEMMPAVIYHIVSIAEPIPEPQSMKRLIERHLQSLRGKITTERTDT